MAVTPRGSGFVVLLMLATAQALAEEPISFAKQVAPILSDNCLACHNGRTAKGGNPQFARPGLKKLIEKVGEKPGQRVPPDWTEKAVLPQPWGPEAWKK